jgi:hypothetical protein
MAADLAVDSCAGVGAGVAKAGGFWAWASRTADAFGGCGSAERRDDACVDEARPEEAWPEEAWPEEAWLEEDSATACAPTETAKATRLKLASRPRRNLILNPSHNTARPSAA